MRNNISSERNRIGKSQAELARCLGVSEPTLRAWEQGHRSIPSRYVLEMSKLFNCTTDYLLGIANERLPIRMIAIK